MQCVLCKQGTTTSGWQNVVLEQGNSTVIIKEVPAEICQECGEYYLSESVTKQVLAQARTAIAQSIEIVILKYQQVNHAA